MQGRGTGIDVVGLNAAAWDDLADVYHQRNPVRVTAMLEDLAAVLPPGSRVLDIGSGTGLPVDAFLVGKGFEVTGIDVSRRMIDIARANVPAATYIHASITSIQLDRAFDGAVASHSLLLLDPPRFQVAAAAIGTALKPGGWCYVSLNEPANPREDPDADTIIDLHGVTVYSRAYTESEARIAFSHAGMHLERMERKIVHSALFGEEHVMELLFKKA